MKEPKPIKAHRFPRAEDDWYVEPPAATEILLEQEEFRGLVLDPCCGQGNVVKTIIAHGGYAVGMDLRDRVKGHDRRWFIGQADFLTQPAFSGNDHIVMNPPYGQGRLAEAFIRRAVSITPEGKVAAFVEARFVFGAGRARTLFADIPPARIHIITPRQSCPPGTHLEKGNKAEGGTPDHVWLVWERRTAPGETRTIWRRRR